MMCNELDAIIADPAGNITVFIDTDTCKKEQYADIAKKILAQPKLKAEQVGFIQHPHDLHGMWYLEMMGGEFCGNAARSFGLYAAMQQNIKGRQTINIGISGASAPVAVEFDTDTNFAQVKMPLPVALCEVQFNEASLPVYFFEGIVHIIAQDIEPSKENFYRIKESAEHAILLNNDSLPDALGVMFHNNFAQDSSNQPFIQPAVYVYKTDSMVFESSCASGSAAFAVYYFKEKQNGEYSINLNAPGGAIEVSIKKTNGIAEQILIGGTVLFQKKRISL
ncbi:MAG: hypothetical protein LBV52_03130 [Spirochaetaceae bacterium]|jgi:diaminopimelate epimerase|nr:hypothetical protein [Spirochaetaceae bacterium]